MMPSFCRRLAVIGAVSLLMSGLMSWAGAEPASSGPPNVVHSKQFSLPPSYGTELMRSQRRGKALYLYYCATCHGDTGNSDGFNSYSLKQPPPKFSDAKFMQSLSDDSMRRIIKEGGRGVGSSPQMPHWKGVLSDQNITDLIHFIHTLAK
jgi:cytochrome c553